MKKIKVIVADFADEAAFEILPSKTFEIYYHPNISGKELIKTYSEFEALIIRSTRRIDKNYIQNSNHKVIATLSKGTDHIDIDSAKKKKVKIIYSESGNYISAAEHTLGLMIAVSKNFLIADAKVRSGKFNDIDFRRNELRGKKLGIIGYGKVGKYVAKLSKAIGMKIYANDIDEKVIRKNHGQKLYQLNSILKTCDIVSLHIPSSKENFHFMNKERLSLLKKDSILINTSRGNIIEEKKLIELLRGKKIRFAALDVFEREPEVNPELWKLKNILLTNHIAGKTIESKMRVSRHIFLELRKFFKSRKFKN
jgi:D-3-phosphoglycerate dehydrogenase / 2-oxoglutarate reductase